MKTDPAAEREPAYGSVFGGDNIVALAAQLPSLIAAHGVDEQSVAWFRAVILHHFRHYGRQFSWRTDISPYRVLVSEIMLQQTQTARVEPKFAAFVARFPGFAELAAAPFAEVLRCWKGLGYNRRARYLHDTARLVAADCGGLLPRAPDTLATFPGIGKATAASICVFAFNQAHPFIETNIRTVFIHFFFAHQEEPVTDAALMPFVELTMDRDQPRRWYYALMDYGVMLKKTVGNLSRRSSHYQKQSPFAGSDRQLRGRILQLLLDQRETTVDEAALRLAEPRERIAALVAALCSEGLVASRRDRLQLT